MNGRSGSLHIGAIEYRWSVYREPQWCTADGWKGLAILIEPNLKPSRQLILQLPFRNDSRRSTPHRQRPSVSVMELESYINEALSNGWSAASKGKPVVFEPKGIELSGDEP